MGRHSFDTIPIPQRMSPLRLVVATCCAFVFGLSWYGLKNGSISKDSLLERYYSACPLQQSAAHEQPKFHSFFVFGDSYTAQPWEERGKEAPSLVSKFKVDGKWKRKPNWVNFLAEDYIGTNPHTYSFAEGGSTTNHNIVPPGFFGSSLIKQSDKFVQEYGGATPPANWQSDTSLFLIAFGVNDMIGLYEAYYGDGPMPILPLRDIFHTYTETLEKIYAVGGRNFLLMAISPIDRSLPPYTHEAALDKRRIAFGIGVASYNARMLQTALAFRRNYTDVRINFFDQNRLYASAIEDPRQYSQLDNVKNTVDLCRDAQGDKQVGVLDWDFEINVCQSGELSQSYIWHPIHASYPIHNLTSARIAEDCYGSEGPTGFCS